MILSILHCDACLLLKITPSWRGTALNEHAALQSSLFCLLPMQSAKQVISFEPCRRPSLPADCQPVQYATLANSTGVHALHVTVKNLPATHVVLGDNEPGVKVTGHTSIAHMPCRGLSTVSGKLKVVTTL